MDGESIGAAALRFDAATGASFDRGASERATSWAPVTSGTDAKAERSIS
jgi:hypothetical protein